MKISVVIISGGSGSRLWPLSTNELPKPFLPLVEEKNLFEKTLTRINRLKTKDLLVVTSQKFYELHLQTVAKTNFSSSFLLEPEGRNTAPAILMAAKLLEEKFGKEQLMLVLPADHLIENYQKFSEAVHLAAEKIQQDDILTFGIQPTYPETGYGYICTENNQTKISKVKQFVEKPNLATANKYLTQGNYFWNSGMFLFSVKSILQAFKKQQPQMWAHSLVCHKQTLKKNNTYLLNKKYFAQFESISIDYAIMEKHKPIYVIKSDFDWNDIGSWNSAAKLIKADENGNRLQGSYFSLDNKNVFLKTQQNFYGLLGLEDISIVEGNGQILIANNQKLQATKKIFEYQKKQQTASWGLSKILSQNPKTEQITIYANKKYKTTTKQKINLININQNSNSLTINNKELNLKSGENVLITEQTKIIIKNLNSKKQHWLKTTFHY